VEKVRYRHNTSILVAGIVMLCGGLALATSRWYLAPILLVPLALIVWGWRAGTDVDADGVRVRALLGTRTIAWTEINGFTRHGDRVLATLTTGRAVTLPAVSPDDMGTLVRAGQPAGDAPAEPDDDTDTDS
jgi:Bacterial PH domain